MENLDRDARLILAPVSFSCLPVKSRCPCWKQSGRMCWGWRAAAGNTTIVGKNLGHYGMGLDKAQPPLCWLKGEKTCVLNSRLREGSFCTAHPARGRNGINDAEKDQPVILLEIIGKQFPVTVAKTVLGWLEEKQDESLVCQAGLLHCCD